jgi:hypothetical protein
MVGGFSEISAGHNEDTHRNPDVSDGEPRMNVCVSVQSAATTDYLHGETLQRASFWRLQKPNMMARCIPSMTTSPYRLPQVICAHAFAWHSLLLASSQCSFPLTSMSKIYKQKIRPALGTNTCEVDHNR